MTSKLARVVAVAAAVAACAFAPLASAQQVAGSFGQGRTHVFITGGTGYAFDNSYFVLGAGVTYYLFDGLGLGLSYESWTGSDPGVSKITPSVQYVFYQAGALKPYVGGFYRRTEIDGLPSLDSVGARVGAYFQAGRSTYIGFGAVYESYQDCTPSVYRKCESTYPELSFTVAF